LFINLHSYELSLDKTNELHILLSLRDRDLLRDLFMYAIHSKITPFLLNSNVCPCILNYVFMIIILYTVIPRLTSDPANEFFG